MLPLSTVYLIKWQKELEFEEERRKSHRTEPCVNYLAAVQPCRKEPTSIFGRLFSLTEKDRRMLAEHEGNPFFARERLNN